MCRALPNCNARNGTKLRWVVDHGRNMAVTYKFPPTLRAASANTRFRARTGTPDAFYKGYSPALTIQCALAIRTVLVLCTVQSEDMLCFGFRRLFTIGHLCRFLSYGTPRTRTRHPTVRTVLDLCSKKEPNVGSDSAPNTLITEGSCSSPISQTGQNDRTNQSDMLLPAGQSSEAATNCSERCRTEALRSLILALLT
jgi:hypothetical protein